MTKFIGHSIFEQLLANTVLLCFLWLNGWWHLGKPTPQKIVSKFVRKTANATNMYNQNLLGRLMKQFSKLYQFWGLSRDWYWKGGIPYRAKLCRAKLSVGRNFRHFRPTKSFLKWSTSEPTSDSSHSEKLWLYFWAKVCRAEFSSAKLFVGWNFRYL